MNRLLIFSSIILFAALFVTACGVSTPSSSAAPSTDPSTPIVTLSKPATISQQPAVAVSPTPSTLPAAARRMASPMPTASILSADRALLGVYENGNTPDGPQTLTLLNDGRYTQQLPTRSFVITGTWTISAGQLVFLQTEVSNLDTTCNNMTGSYKWVLAGKKLTLTAVNEDDCPYRQEDFTSGPWLKKP